MKVRVRLAPSPTGFLHIGTARTALFNYLFAKKHGGQFVLRIEDTDLERSDKKFEKDILENLQWLGLDWDEGPVGAAAEGGLLTNQYKGSFGPYRQSERLATYEKYLKQLLEKGFAYYCYCTKEELEGERQAMLAQGLAPKYSGRCRAGKPKNAAESQLIRFRIPDTHVSFKDMIRGEISFNTNTMGDVAIAKNLKTPLYNFAVVIDDHEMEITHVIRGEDHIPNTPKQILFMEALGFTRPHYAHLPLILDSDRSKMSKRYAATSIEEYRHQGYLPEALINFLVLLGWHPTNDQEIFSKEELASAFDLSRVQKAGAVFNIEKLNWLNSQYIKKMPDEKLVEKLDIEPTTANLKIIKLTKERLVRLTDFKRVASFFFQLPNYAPELLLWKQQAKKEALANLEAVKKIINNPKKILVLAEAKGRGEVLWPLRVALSGLEASPGPLEILEVLGRGEAEQRIDAAIAKLK